MQLKAPTKQPTLPQGGKIGFKLHFVIIPKFIIYLNHSSGTYKDISLNYFLLC